MIDSLQQQFEPVLHCIRRKLCHWSSRHLSLAGRALVANQVILASVWYIASCWMLHTGIMHQLRRLVRNFLWGGSDGSHDTRARVRWDTIILPSAEGGLGIIDPEIQSRALLSKLIIRGREVNLGRCCCFLLFLQWSHGLGFVRGVRGPQAIVISLQMLPCACHTCHLLCDPCYKFGCPSTAG